MLGTNATRRARSPSRRRNRSLRPIVEAAEERLLLSATPIDYIPGTGGLAPVNLASKSGMLYFERYNAQLDVQLWSSNGTDGGTQPVEGVPAVGPGILPPPGTWVTSPLGGISYFLFDGNHSGNPVVWSVSSSGVAEPQPDGLFSDVGLGDLTFCNLQLFFTQNIPEFSQWNLDTLPKEIYITDGLGVSNLTPAGSKLFMDAAESDNPYELYVYDPSLPAGSQVHLVTDIGTNSYGPNIYDLTALGSSVYFGADDGVHGIQLWTSDGTAAGTQMIVIGSGPSEPSILGTVGNSLIFTAYDGSKTMLYSLAAGSTTPQPLRQLAGDSPELTLAGDHLYGVISSPQSTGLYSIDASGTLTQIKDSDPAHDFRSPNDFTESGGSVYFVATLPATGDPAIWKIVDPTHVVPVATNFMEIDSLASLNGALYAAANGNDAEGHNIGDELWRIDDTVHPPVAKDATASTRYQTPVLIDVLKNDSDPDGNPLNITAVTQPKNGTATFNATTGITYTPNAGYSGVDTFTYTISDEINSATANVTVTVAKAPVVVPTISFTRSSSTYHDKDLYTTQVIVQLSKPTTVPVSVSFRIVKATLNATTDIDLTAIRTLTIPAGATFYNLRYKIYHTGKKRYGYAIVALFNPRNAKLGGITTHEIILNDKGRH